MNGFSIFAETICDGIVPVERDEKGDWVVYQCKAEALNEITDDFLEYQRQFFAGERSFEDAMIVDWEIKRVNCMRDGSIVDPDGRVFPKGFHA